ncbi:MAG: hypothetical protein B7X31_15240, partial [Thiomonas sp. 13-66-29]
AMNPQALLPTATLLGAFVIFAGLYAMLYAAGKMRRSRALQAAGYVSYAAQCLVVAGLWWLSPLALAWKLLLVATGLFCSVIPSLAWRHLHQLHQLPEA